MFWRYDNHHFNFHIPEPTLGGSSGTVDLDVVERGVHSLLALGACPLKAMFFLRTQILVNTWGNLVAQMSLFSWSQSLVARNFQNDHTEEQSCCRLGRCFVCDTFEPHKWEGEAARSERSSPPVCLDQGSLEVVVQVLPVYIGFLLLTGRKWTLIS